MTTLEAAKLIRNSEGRFFTVKFIKRTDGSVREMNCRTGVVKHLRGGDAAYNFSEKGLISVYSLDAEGYRTIPIENILELRFGGNTYKVKPTQLEMFP